MAVVVGFNWPIEHDHAAAAIVDGKLVFASEEKRYTRHKYSPGEPPFYSLYYTLKYLKEKFGINPQDVTHYAVNWEPKLFR